MFMVARVFSPANNKSFTCSSEIEVKLFISRMLCTSSYCKTYWVFQNYRLHYSELQLNLARYFFGNVYLSRTSCLQ